MSLEERMNKIEKRAEAMRQEAEDAKNRKIEEDEKLLKIFETKNMATRISDLIKLAEKCYEETVYFPSNASAYGYGQGEEYDKYYDFLLRNGSPLIGFFHVDDTKICIGVFDKNDKLFQTKGNPLAEGYVAGNLTLTDMNLMKHFLEDFDAFEKAFYNWIDSL